MKELLSTKWIDSIEIFLCIFKTNANSGLIEHHIIDNKPVIQLLNIKSLSHKYNLPFDYKGVHTIGDGDVYLEYKKIF